MKKLFSFKGRINRGEYAMTMVCYIAFCGIVEILTLQNAIYGVLGILYLPFVYIIWAQGAKRCHDLNKSGWWQLIPFYVLWMLFQRGTKGPNEYDEGFTAYYGADDYEKPFDIDEEIVAPVPVVDTDHSRYMPK